MILPAYVRAYSSFLDYKSEYREVGWLARSFFCPCGRVRSGIIRPTPERKATIVRSKGILSLLIVIAGTMGLLTVPTPAQSDPAAEEIVAKMIEAHGGFDMWAKCPTVSFDTHLKVDFGGGNWVEFWEKVTVEQGTRRAYAELPNADGTSGSIAFDGENAWSAGNLQGISNAPARFTAWRDFYLFNVPWLTQDAGVILGEPGKATIPNDAKEYITVPMNFEDGTGDTSKDTYVLYIDPDTYRLKATEYGMTFKSMLPEGADSSPHSVFVWEETTEVGGLLVPTKYNVYWKEGGALVTAGEVSNWSFDKAFDESRMKMPSDGTVDGSVPH